MFAVEVCSLPVTGGATGVAVAAIFLLVLGVVVARWVRASAGRMSVVAVVPLLLLGIGAASTQPSSTSCNSSTVTTTIPEVTAPPTTFAPTTTTTVVPVDPNLVLQIDIPEDIQGVSISAMDAGVVYELGLFGDVDVHVDWGDGSPDSDVEVAGPFAHTYVTWGQYTITVSGSLTGFGQDEDDAPLSGAEYLTAVTSFGDLGIESLSNAFWDSNNLIDVPSVLPATVTDLYGLFWSASSFNDDISDWNTANVTNMSYLFEDAGSFNGDISSWNTSSVTDMNGMFDGASVFNQSLSSWVTSSVTDMNGMFAGASSFDQSLSSWNVSLVTSMQNMLSNSAMSSANYAATLIGWASQTVKTNVVFGANGKSVGSYGSAGCSARQLLLDSPSSWIITDSSDCNP